LRCIVKFKKEEDRGGHHGHRSDEERESNVIVAGNF